jgi:hypothetical protein
MTTVACAFNSFFEDKARGPIKLDCLLEFTIHGIVARRQPPPTQMHQCTEIVTYTEPRLAPFTCGNHSSSELQNPALSC